MNYQTDTEVFINNSKVNNSKYEPCKQLISYHHNTIQLHENVIQSHDKLIRHALNLSEAPQKISFAILYFILVEHFEKNKKNSTEAPQNALEDLKELIDTYFTLEHENIPSWLIDAFLEIPALKLLHSKSIIDLTNPDSWSLKVNRSIFGKGFEDSVHVPSHPYYYYAHALSHESLKPFLFDLESYICWKLKGICIDVERSRNGQSAIYRINENSTTQEILDVGC